MFPASLKVLRWKNSNLLMNWGSTDALFCKTNYFFESKPCSRVSTHESITEPYSLVGKVRLPNLNTLVKSTHLKNKTKQNRAAKSILLLHIYPIGMLMNIFFYQKTYTRTFIAVLFVMAKTRDPSNKQNSYVNCGVFHNEILQSHVNGQLQIHETIQIRSQQTSL